jgi:hypothetical protein
MVFVTVAKGLIWHVCTFDQPTSTTKPFVNYTYSTSKVAPLKQLSKLKLELCGAVQLISFKERPQRPSMLVLTNPSSGEYLHCAYMDPKTVQQMEVICGQQGCHHPRRHLQQHETRAASVQSCRFNITGNRNRKSFVSIVVEGTTMAIETAINLAQLRSQYFSR